MADQDIHELWQIVQEFILGLERQDPTIRRWLVPNSQAAMWLDLYGEPALLLLLQQEEEGEKFVLVRASPPPGKDSRRFRLIEIGWVDSAGRPRSKNPLVTLHLRLYRHHWRVDDIWPAPMDQPISLHKAREMAEVQGEQASLAIRLVAGHLELPLEGCGTLEDVEAIFVVGMNTRGYSPLEVIRALRLWRSFQRRAHATEHQPTILAAAVEYAINYLGGYPETLDEIASFYSVSTSSLETCFQEIRDQLNLVPLDPRYTPPDEPAR
jgi:hypothetical protein